MEATAGTKPQPERDQGFDRIPHLILEALSIANLNRTQFHICTFILRRTYGWHRKYDAIPLTQFAEACRTNKQNISRQIKYLTHHNIIRCLVNVSNRTSVYCIVADPNQWDQECIDHSALAANQNNSLYNCTPAKDMDWPSIDEYIAASGKLDPELEDWTDNDLNESREPFQDMPARSHDDMTTRSHNGMTISDEGLFEKEMRSHNHMTTRSHDGVTTRSHDGVTFDQPSAQAGPASEPPLKIDLKIVKDKYIYLLDSIEYQLSQLLLIQIRARLPNFKEPNLQKWSETMAQIIRLDKRDPGEIREVILFAQSDPFWCSNILSVRKLREKYDQLNLKRITRREIQRQSQAKAIEQNKLDDWSYESDEYAQFFKRQ